MSALARFFHSQGIRVAGYDKTRTPLTRALESEGISIIYDDSETALLKQISGAAWPKASTLVVLTPAIPQDHQGWQWLKSQKYKIYKRAKVLGLISSNFYTIAVAGTHGKTTTSTLIAHILKDNGVDIMAFLGGISANYQTNYIAPETEYPFMVVEADEFDRSFLHLNPNDAVITSTDADHLDIYGKHDAMYESFVDFSKCLKPGGLLLIKKDIEIYTRFRKRKVSYSINRDADFRADRIRVSKGKFYFDLLAGPMVWKNMEVGLPGWHNVENALAAAVICLNLGLGEKQIRKSLANFKGVKRRFEYILREDDFKYIDDYAHHPSELEAAIRSARTLYPGKKLTGVFQPHLYTRTRDFAVGFAQSLSLLDEVFMLDIYPARELPLPGVDSQMILDQVQAPFKKLVTKKQLVKELQKRSPEVLLTLGAGDIDTMVEPIAKAFQSERR